MLPALRTVLFLFFAGAGSLRGAEILSTKSAANSSRKVIGEVLEFGTFELKGQETRKRSKTTPDGFTIGAPDARFTRCTEFIEPTPGVRFGFRFRIRNLPDQREVVFHTVVRHPLMRLPSGRTRDHYEKETRLPVFAGTVSETTGYGLDHDFERMPGRWTFEHWFGGRLVVSQSFTVPTPQERQARQNQLRHCGSLPYWFVRKSSELPLTTELAMLLVCSSASGESMDNLQTQARYGSLWRGPGKVFQLENALLWKRMLLENEAASIYGRMIAAGFFLRVADADARHFLETQIRSYYRRYVLNATYVLLYEFSLAPNDIWIQDHLIELLQDERLLDPVENDPYEDFTLYEEGDSGDLRPGLFRKVCANLGFRHCRRAVPALMQWIDSDQADSAISALGDIGDRSVASQLMKRMGKTTLLDTTIITALGKLHYEPIIAVAIEHLEATLRGDPAAPHDKDECVRALGDLKAKEAIPVIEAWVARSAGSSEALARRTLAHLENDDPVPTLFQLLADEENEYCKCDLIYDLAATRSKRAVGPFVEIAKTSPHTGVRTAAVRGLARIGSDESLQALLALSREEHQGWQAIKGTTAQDIIVEGLAGVTGENFGPDFAAWEKWLREHPGFPEMTE